jgi:hypothetical protein
MLITSKQAPEKEETGQNGLDGRVFSKITATPHLGSFVHHRPGLVGTRRGRRALINLNRLR